MKNHNNPTYSSDNILIWFDLDMSKWRQSLVWELLVRSLSRYDDLKPHCIFWVFISGYKNVKPKSTLWLRRTMICMMLAMLVRPWLEANSIWHSFADRDHRTNCVHVLWRLLLLFCYIPLDVLRVFHPFIFSAYLLRRAREATIIIIHKKVYFFIITIFFFFVVFNAYRNNNIVIFFFDFIVPREIGN